jgi:glucan phosphoethanolaminetransferase (alkaline phosphatase superfamily)
MHFQYDKRFLISGLIMFVLGLLAPIYSPYALAKIGILQAHLIGALQALVFFSFAWMWPHLSLPKFSKSIATVCLYISLWANWIGTLFVGIFGAGKEQYIVNQDLVPGAKGFWNIATLLLINLSQLAVLAVVLAIIGFLGWVWTAKKERITNFISSVLFVAILLISFFQTFNPQYSNG